MVPDSFRRALLVIRRSSTWMKLTSLARSERGVSLPEILVATVIAASVAGLLGTTVYQFFRATTDGRNHLAVQNSVRNASLWLGRDATEAQSFSPGSGTTYGTFITGEPSIKFRYSYDASEKALVRDYLVDDVVQTSQAVARNIENQGDVVFSVTGGLLTVTITTTSPDGSASEDLTLNLAMRVR
jgi:Tfp pilus assembly protein PilV